MLARLGALERLLRQLQRLDATTGPLQESYDAAYYALDAVARELDRYQGGVELDPARLAQVRQRRDVLFGLIKKYGPTLADVIAPGPRGAAGTRSRSTRRVSTSTRCAIARPRPRARSAAGGRADAQTPRRRGAALGRAVDALLPELGMPDGHLEVALAPRAEIAAEGAEDVEFRVSLNVGHDARPLARVASGGELSRVMLALKTILARLDHVPTLVFDEVDAGIGGRVGLQVGDTMRRVAATHQVFAITHLPQIAARAHHHIRVSKDAAGGRDHRRRGRARGRGAGARDRPHARRRPGERGEPGPRRRAAGGRGRHGRGGRREPGSGPPRGRGPPAVVPDRLQDAAPEVEPHRDLVAPVRWACAPRRSALRDGYT